MKTSTFLLLLLFSSFFVYAQENTCLLNYRIGYNMAFWNVDSEHLICKGGSLKITCSSISNANYVWRKNGVIIPNANKEVYYAQEEGKYTAEVLTKDCKFVTPIVTYKLTNRFDNYGFQLNNEYSSSITGNEFAICEYGEKFAININGIGYLGEIEYQWQKDGVDLDGATDMALFIDKQGVYSVRARQGECALQSKPLKVNVTNQKMSSLMRFGNGGSVFIPSGDTLNLCDNTTITLSNSHYYATNKWYKDKQLINGANDRNLVVSTSGVYHYENTLANGCETKSDSVVVIFGKKLNKPTIQFSKETGGCYARMLGISDNDFYSNYLFSIDGKYKISWFKNSNYMGEYWSVPAYTGENALYKITVDVGSCSVEDTFEFDSNKSRAVKLSGRDIKNGKVSFCAGYDFDLKFPVSYGSSANYYKIQWFKDGTPIGGNVSLLKVKESGHYYATFSAVDNSCIQYSDTVAVTALAAPAIKITKKASELCQFSFQTTQTEGTTYAWKKDGKLIAGANSFEFLPKDIGVYSLVSNRGYCAYESNKITFEASKKAVLAEKRNYCENDTLKLNSPEADAYLWKGPNNFSSDLKNPGIPNAKMANSGLYVLRTTIDKCVLTDSVFINIGHTPSITLDRADQYCLGKNVSMVANAHNYDIVWEDPMKNNYYSGYISIENASKNFNGTYKATATDYYSGCTTTISTHINLKEEQCNSIELLVPKSGLCSYKENELNYVVSGNFSKDEEFTIYIISSRGEKKALETFSKSPIKLKDFSHYNIIWDFWGTTKLMIESKTGKVQSNQVEVRFNYANSWVNLDNSSSVCDGPVPMKLTTQSVPVDSIPFYFKKVQWYKDNVAIPNANSYLFSATASGKYHVKFERDGCVFDDRDINTVEVKIGEIETPRVSIESNNDILNICKGFNEVLYAGFEVGKIKDVQYQWQLDGKDIPNATLPRYTAASAGNYSLKIKQGTCQNTSSSVRVIEGDLFAPVIGLASYNYTLTKNTVEICEGTQVSLSLSNYSYISRNGKKFQWQKDNVDIPLANSQDFTTSENGTYRLKISLGDCSIFSNPVIVKYGSPKALFFGSNSTEFCKGESVSVRLEWPNTLASTELYAKIYKDNKVYNEVKGDYFTNISESGSYHAALSFAVASNGKTCTIYSDTLRMNFNENVINYNLSSAGYISICADSSYLQGNTISNLSQPRYQWKFNGVNLPNANTKDLVAKQSGSYQLELKGESQCAYVSNPVTVTLNKLEATIARYSQLCYDSLSALNITINSKLGYNNQAYEIPVYEWRLNGKTIGKESSVALKQEGMYVMTTTQGKCAVSDSIRINNSDLKAAIPKNLSPNVDSLSICPEGTVSIVAPQGDFTYAWLRNDQAIDNLKTQTINVSSEGTYKVWIEKGECSRMSSTIKVQMANVYPTAFISGNKEIMNGDSAKIRIDLTSLPPWTIKLTNNQEFRALSTPFEFAVKPQQTTVYELASVSNDCGVGTVSGKAEIKLIILGNEELAGAKVKLYPVPTQGICQLSVETVIPEKIGFQLYNVDGKMLLKTEEEKAGTLFNEVVNLESMPEGVYVLKIKIGNKILNRKIIKGN